METKVQRWGNSLGLRIPRSFAAEARLDAGSTVDITVENGRLVVRASRPKYEIESLIRAINSRNIHDAVETGTPVGREIW